MYVDSRWFHERFAGGGARMGGVGIVALARRLLVAVFQVDIEDPFEQPSPADVRRGGGRDFSTGSGVVVVGSVEALGTMAERSFAWG
ncbi:MAG: hypothetical protein ACRD9S_24095 [Pyrinomonadaceae bacterium]